MRPRLHFGADPKGRLPAAMLRALTAELSDPGRFGRAKAYARDQAVFDIQVEPGAVRGLIQGSRSEPYEAVVFARPLDPEERAAAEAGGASAIRLLPRRADLAVTCTCPDGDTSGMVCKHALATLLVLADEVTIEPALLDRWRAGPPLDRATLGHSAADELAEARQRNRAARRLDPAEPSGGSPRAPIVDVLAERLQSPARLPALPELGPLPPIPATDDLTEILATAHAALRP